jgi:hypothetical protein
MTRIVAIAGALLVLAVTGASASADTGPIGLWHLDEGTGTVTADGSGHAENGTLFGDAQWVSGRSAAALGVSGTGGVRILDAPLLEPTTGVSVSAWVKQSGSPGSYRYILAKGASGCVSASYALFTGATGGLAFYVSNGHGSAYVLSPDAGRGIWDGQWHLVVGTFDGSAVRLFVDGSQVGSGTPHSSPIEYLLTDSNDLYIGNYPSVQASPGCQARGFVGAIDEVGVWGRALTPAQIGAITSQPTVGSPTTPATPGAPASGEPPPAAAGGGTTETGQPPKAVGPPSIAPALGHLKVSASAVSFASIARTRGSEKSKIVATITYTDTEAARTTFTLLDAQAGVVQKGRCVRPTARNSRKRVKHCTRYVALGRFTHADRAGSNRVQFIGLAGRRLTPDRYRLDAVPAAHGQAGKTISAGFTVTK